MRVQNYINGKWVDSYSEARYLDINPATEEPVAEVVRSDERDVEAAVEAAAAAFEKWRKVPAPKRAEILYRVGQLLVERKEQLARLLTQEMGKVLPEARGDVQEAIDMAFYIGGEGRRLLGYTAPVELPNKFGMAVRDPIGVVACITPWNFPIAIPSWKIFPALVAGNTVIFKPATDTPATAAEFVRIFEEAGLPPGVLNLVIGPGPTVGNALVEHPTVKAISFTGSTEVGRDLYARAARHLKRVSLEMGGKNAIIVMEDANLELALEATLWAAFGTTGQRCTACSRLILHKPIKEKFTEMLVERTKRLRLGNGLEPTTDVGPLINEAAVKKVHSYVEIGKAEGARLLCGGNPVKVNGKGFFYEPTIFDQVRPDMRIAQEEIFGPVLSVIAYDDVDDAVRIANDSEYGLAGTVWTADREAGLGVARRVRTGTYGVNTYTMDFSAPFGGFKA
ncbi:MAG: aldehyde dehydrogenase family protein, partial [Thermoflexus sp.]